MVDVKLRYKKKIRATFAFSQKRRLSNKSKYLSIQRRNKLFVVGVFFFAFIFLCFTFPFHSTITNLVINSPSNVTALDSEGTCGTGTTYTFRDGTLTISGSGGGYVTGGVFNGNDCIVNVVIGEGVAQIGDRVFDECRNLVSVTFPDSLMKIHSYAFSECVKLSSLTIPKKVDSIDYTAFGYCESLASITVDSDNNVYDSRNNCNAVIYSDTNRLILGCKNTNIPETVEELGEYAFLGCSGLTSVSVPSSVEWIGSSAFEGCIGLTSLTIPSGVNKIFDYTFAYCSGLKSLTIPSHVTSIAQSAFAYCGSLTSITVDSGNANYDSRNDCNAIIQKAYDDETWGSAGAILIRGCKNTTIPDVEDIGNYAFSGCADLSNVSIPASVLYIGEYAFEECSGLTSINIPKNVELIGSYAFVFCSGLESITVDSANTTYDSRNNCNAIIEKSTNTLIVGCKNTVIPSTVTIIGISAFCGCNGLVSLTIPDGVTEIAGDAFYECGNLTTLVIPKSVTKFDEVAIRNCGNLQSITVDSANTTYDSRNECNAIIETSTNTLVAGCKTTVIPYGVLSIAQSAFEGSKVLNITIPDSVTEITGNPFDECPNLTITGASSGVAFTFAKEYEINYMTFWSEVDADSHSRTYYAFETNENDVGTVETSTHVFENDVCTVCGMQKGIKITLNVETNVSRYFMMYILDSDEQVAIQLLVTNESEIEITVEKDTAFTIQIFETLYMRTTIGEKETLKRTYTLSANTTIPISISGVTGVNNWIVV